jgi:predicted Fe-Mo cluster-binding NifX family protein
MKICVPAETDTGVEARVPEHFGRAPYIAVADTETGRVEVRRAGGCHDDHHVGQVRDAGAEAVACRGLGRRAFAALQAAGIPVLISTRDTVAEVIEDARQGRLRAMADSEACGGGHHHHHRHGQA